MAPSLAGPALRFSQEFCSDSPTAEYRFHVPAFDEPNRMGRIATIGVRPQRNFDEPDQRTIVILGHEHDGRQVPARSAGEEWGDVFCMPLKAFIARCEAYFAWGGCIIDQAFQPRLPEGMIRCYMSGSKVAGFGHQLIKALIPLPPEGPESPVAQPGPRIMHGPNAPPFQALRRLMEDRWTPQMMEALAMDEASLPVIWDADFLYGPRDAAGANTYVLCEINVSSCFAIPDEAPAAIARTVKDRILQNRGACSGR